MNRFIFIPLTYYLLATGATYAQTHSKTFMQGKSTGFVGMNLNFDTGTRFFVGPTLMDEFLVFEKIEHTAISIFGVYGISDRLDIGASLSQVNSRGLGNREFTNSIGLESRQEGVQDVRLTGNFLLSEIEIDQGSFRINALAALEFPVGNYRIGEGFQSLVAIGNSTQSFEAGFATLFQSPTDFYFSIENIIKVNATEMPTAIQNQLYAGYMNRNIIIELYADNQWALSGPDIFGIGFDGIFPNAKIQRHILGLYLCKPIGSGLVMTSSLETMFYGQNTNKATGISLGLGYILGQNRMKINHY